MLRLALYIVLIGLLNMCQCHSDNQQEIGMYIQQQKTVSTNITKPLSPSCQGPWTFAKSKGDNTSCHCGSDLGGLVKCDSDSFDVQVLTCYCMSHFQKDANITVVGASMYLCHQPRGRDYHTVLSCGIDDRNRDGQLCGGCRKGFSLPAYSYDWHCVNSSFANGYAQHWIKYVVVAYVPLTVFFLIVTGFHISAPSPSMNAFVLVSQLATAPVTMRILTDSVDYRGKNNSIRIPVQKAVPWVASLFSMWNLDFFRLNYTPFAVHPSSVSTLQVLALDYAVAAYPLFLIVATYVLVELHDNNFRIVVWLWKPFHYCFDHYRRQWDIRTSLIDTFATFFLLSYVKFLSVSFDLLIPVFLYNAKGETLSDLYLYYDGTIEYFGKQHLPYAILVIVILILVNLLPLLLLLLYPCPCFQKVLNFCGLRCHAFHTFTDVFQGCYKNRTDGTCDRRWFSAVYLVVRFAFLVVVAMTQNTLMGCLFETILLILTAVLVIVIQPYKSHVYNIVDVVLILAFALFYCSTAIVLIANIERFAYIIPSGVILAVCAFVPLVYISTVALYWLLLRKKLPQRLCSKLRDLLPCVISHSNLQESLPDRLANPEEYEPLSQGPLSNVLDTDNGQNTCEENNPHSSY